MLSPLTLLVLSSAVFLLEIPSTSPLTHTTQTHTRIKKELQYCNVQAIPNSSSVNLGTIHLARTQNFIKTDISPPFVTNVRVLGGENVTFSDTFNVILILNNKWMML